MQVSFKQSQYTVRESDGRVAITIQAARRYFYDSFYVKIRASVNRGLRHHYGELHTYVNSMTISYISIGGFEGARGCRSYFIKVKIPILPTM